MPVNTSEPIDVDAAEAATLAAWREHWGRWVEAHGREPSPLQDGEAGQLFSMVAAFGGLKPRPVARPGSRFPDPFVGLNASTGEVYAPHHGSLSGLIVKTHGVTAGTPSDPLAAFGCVSLPSGGSADVLRALMIFRTYATKDPGPVHHELARAVVAAKSPGLDEGRATKATRELAASIADTVRGWGPGLGWDWAGLSKLPRLDGGMIPDTVDIGGLDIGASLDTVAGFLDGIRAEGKKAATVYRGKTDPGLWVRPSGPKKAAEEPERPTRSPLLWALACVLWADVVGPALDREAAAREAARSNRAAVARAFVVSEMFPAMAYGAQHEMRGILPDGRELKDRKGRIVARIDGDPDPVLRGLEKFGAPVGHRLVDSLVRRAWANYEANSQDPGAVEYEGGWSGLARAIGHDPKDTATIRALAVAGQSIRWSSGLTHGGGWWTWSDIRGGPGKSGLVRFILGDPLRPAYITSLELTDRAHTPSSREMRRAIPILGYEPPVGSLNERSHGAAWLMARLFVVDLVDRAVELHLNEGIRLDDKQWRALADRAGLPFALLSRLRDAWLTGDDPSKAPPLIKEVGGGLVTLGDAHELERIFITERGMRAAEGRAAGKRGAKAKREAAQKKAPRPRTKSPP